SAGPRLVAGCRSNPDDDLLAGHLLDQFYYSLATLVIHLPPLRERGDDLPWFVERLLERAQADRERRAVGLTPTVWEHFRAYYWPGNLRELYMVLVGASGRAKGERIDVPDLPAYLRLAVNLDQTPVAEVERELPRDLLLEHAERRLIVLALELAQGNK